MPSKPDAALPEPDDEALRSLAFRRVPALTITGPTGTATYVPAANFLAVQKERDEYRRALAMISAWRLNHDRSDDMLHRILGDVGETVENGKAVLGIIRELAPRAGL